MRHCLYKLYINIIEAVQHGGRKCGTEKGGRFYELSLQLTRSLEEGARDCWMVGGEILGRQVDSTAICEGICMRGGWRGAGRCEVAKLLYQINFCVPFARYIRFGVFASAPASPHIQVSVHTVDAAL